MQIRAIEEKDNPIMEQIIERSLEDLGLAIPGTAYFDPELGRLAQFYQNEIHAAYFVAEDENGEIYGGVGIAPFDAEAGICELQKLYVIPAAQGKGTAKQLMQAALDFAEEHYAYCYLETLTGLKAAYRLYEKFGFEAREQPLGESGHNAMDTWMLKTLR